MREQRKNKAVYDEEISNHVHTKLLFIFSVQMKNGTESSR